MISIRKLLSLSMCNFPPKKCLNKNKTKLKFVKSEIETIRYSRLDLSKGKEVDLLTKKKLRFKMMKMMIENLQ
jgi:hypothetical protein